IPPTPPSMAGPFGPPRQVITDASGHYVFDGLTPGRYRLDVERPGFAPLFDPWSMMGSPNMGTFELTAGQVMDGVNLALKKGGAISGQVIDGAGEPVVGANVVALRPAPRPNNPPPGMNMPRFVPAGGGASTNDLGE